MDHFVLDNPDKDDNHVENVKDKELAINIGVKELKILGKLEEAFTFVDGYKNEKNGYWERKAELGNNLEILVKHSDRGDRCPLTLDIYKKENKENTPVEKGMGKLLLYRDGRILIDTVDNVKSFHIDDDKAIVDFFKRYFTVSHDDNKSLDSLKIVNFSKQMEILNQKISEALKMGGKYLYTNQGQVNLVHSKFSPNQYALAFTKGDKTSTTSLIIEADKNGRPRIIKRDTKPNKDQRIDLKNDTIIYESETGQFDTKFIEKVAEAIENASVPLTSQKLRIKVPEKAKGFEDIKVEASSSFKNLADQMQSEMQKARDKQGRIGEKNVGFYYDSKEESIELSVGGLSKIKIKRGNKGEILSNAFVDEKGNLNVVANVDRKLKSRNVADVLLKALDTTEKNAFSFKIINEDSYDLWGKFSYIPYGERIE